LTRLAVLADIHGNLPALEAVLADLAQFQADQVIVAGDVINWGPFSAQVMERVAAEGWTVIRGNNEYYLLDHETARAPAAWRDRNQWAMLDWLRAQLAGRWHNLIAAWPDTLSLRFPDAPAIRVVHGTPRDNTESLYPHAPEIELAERLAGVDEPTVIAAHTHLAMERHVPRPGNGSGWQVLNPGSVGVPLDGQFLGRYLLLEGDAAGWRATFRSVPIDPAPVLAEFERQGFVEQIGIVGHFVREEFRHARLELLPFLRWHREHHPGQPFSVELLAAYQAADPVAYLPEPYRPGWERDGTQGRADLSSSPRVPRMSGSCAPRG
jgi:predicted phosphodiesterase